MSRALTDLLVDKLKKACNCIDESLKKDIVLRIGDFWKSQFANDLYYASFAYLLSEACGLDVAYKDEAELENLDFLHKCALARILYLTGKKDEHLLRDISKHKEESVYDIFLKIGVMSDYGVAFKIDTLANKLRLFKNFAGGFSNIIKSQFSSSNASAAGLCVSYLLGKKEPKKSVDFLLASQDKSGGYFAEEDSQIPDLLSTATALFALSLYGHKPTIDPLPFIEAHCLEDGTFSATLKDNKGDIEYTFYGLLAIGCVC